MIINLQPKRLVGLFKRLPVAHADIFQRGGIELGQRGAGLKAAGPFGNQVYGDCREVNGFECESLHDCLH